MPATAPPAQPIQQVRETIDAVLAVLNDAALKAPGKKEARREAVLRTVESRFDFAETARRALGRHWRERTDAERREFVTLFSHLLERAYVGRILAYSGEFVEFLGETVDVDHATIRTRIVTLRDTEIPVDYRLLRRGDRWLIYDVRIEGVSLIENYREQFDDVIAASSYRELVKKIEARLREPSVG